MPLPRATEIVPAPGSGEPVADRVVLAHDERHRRRMRYVAAGGTVFLLDLPRATVLRAGDALRLEDGRLIRVEAAPEALLEVTAPDGGALIRLAWHIGNRHLPAQLEAACIRIREDEVIAAMLRGLGATVVPVHAPFVPEAGAYDAHARAHAHEAHPLDGPEPGHGQDRGQEHAHGRSHEHSHDRSHERSHGHTHGHEHSHGQGHGIGHEHGHPRGGSQS